MSDLIEVKIIGNRPGATCSIGDVMSVNSVRALIWCKKGWAKRTDGHVYEDSKEVGGEVFSEKVEDTENKDSESGDEVHVKVLKGSKDFGYKGDILIVSAEDAKALIEEGRVELVEEEESEEGSEDDSDGGSE